MDAPSPIKSARGLSEAHEQTVVALCAQAFTGISVRVLLFGSRRRGTWVSGSDVDLAFDSQVDLRRPLARLRELLDDSTLPFFFDLVDLTTAAPELRNSVAQEGLVLWEQ